MSTFRFIRIQCRSCHVQLRVEYAHVGKRVRCPACAAIRRIPREDEVQDMLNFMASQQDGALPADVVPTNPPGAVAPPESELAVDETADVQGTDAAMPEDAAEDLAATTAAASAGVEATPTPAEEASA